MGNSWKLISWFIIASLAWSMGYFYNARHGGSLSRLRAMYENKMALAQKINAPQRLLITGGSGAHYTLNSEVIEQELGIPVINLGLDGPVGLNVILASVSAHVKPGDIVLVVPEYQIILDEDGIGDRSIPLVTALGKPYLGNTYGDAPPKEIAENLLMLGQPTLKALTKSAVDLATKGEITGYYAKPLTSRGDATEVMYRKSPWWHIPVKTSITPHAIQKISQFKEEIEQKGANLVLSLPWVYADINNSKTLENVKKTAEELSKISPLIYDSNNFNLQQDTSLFADTQYHLLPEARIIRSEQIAQEIKPIIESLSGQ